MSFLLTISDSLKGCLCMMKEKNTTGITSAFASDLRKTYFLHVIVLITRYSCLDLYARLDFYKQLLVIELFLYFFWTVWFKRNSGICFAPFLFISSFRGFKFTKVNKSNFFVYNTYVLIQNAMKMNTSYKVFTLDFISVSASNHMDIEICA